MRQLIKTFFYLTVACASLALIGCIPVGGSKKKDDGPGGPSFGPVQVYLRSQVSAADSSYVVLFSADPKVESIFICDAEATKNGACKAGVLGFQTLKPMDGVKGAKKFFYAPDPVKIAHRGGIAIYTAPLNSPTGRLNRTAYFSDTKWTEVKQIYVNNCGGATCHNPVGPQRDHVADLKTFNDSSVAISNMVKSGKMPPTGKFKDEKNKQAMLDYLKVVNPLIDQTPPPGGDTPNPTQLTWAEAKVISTNTCYGAKCHGNNLVVRRDFAESEEKMKKSKKTIYERLTDPGSKHMPPPGSGKDFKNNEEFEKYKKYVQSL